MFNKVGNMAEIIAGLITLSLGILWLVMSFSLEQNNVGGNLGLGPGFFPKLVSSFMVILSAFYLVEILRTKKDPIKLLMSKQGALMVLGGVFYLVFLNIMGYAVTTFLYVLISIYVLDRKKSLIDVVAAILIVACLYGVFHMILRVPLPTGILI